MPVVHSIVTWLSLFAAVLLILVAAVAYCSEFHVFFGRRLFQDFRKRPWYAKIVLVILLAQCIVHGSTKTNQMDGAGNGTMNSSFLGLMFVRPSADIPQPPVSAEDIERGFQLVSVSTNDDLSYVMPEGAEHASNWHLRGAYDDVARIVFDDWRFPFGSNSLNQLWAFTWGKIRPEIRDTVHEISAVGAPMSAVPTVSRLWMSETTEGSRLITWESFIVGRLPISEAMTNTPLINAQIELGLKGDFVTRSNNVEKSYRHIDPNDWDGDGWHNDDDDDPIRKAEPFSEFSQSLPYGANPNAYCWIDIVTPYNSHVVFVGDGFSDLEDPALITGAGVTCRIQLLIGKTYMVSSGQPITVTDMSSSDIEITGNGTCALSIVYPVEFSACEGNGGSFTMFTSPSGLTGAYEWTSYCCPITGFGNEFWYAHNWSCLCGGCQASGTFTYEGYSLLCDGGWCCCPCYYDPDEYHYETQVDDGPYAASASVSFSAPAVIFEDTYTNRPGEVVERRSTTTILTCTAHGGSEGTVATFWLSNGSKIARTSGGDLPLTQFVPPGQKLEFEVEYEGCQPSQSENDIIAYASISGSSQESFSELTSVKVQLTAVYEAPENPNPSRHVYGVGEKVRFLAVPALASVVFQTHKFDVGDDTSDYELFEVRSLIVNGGEPRIYTCPISAVFQPPLTARIGDVEYCPEVEIVEPQAVVTTGAAWGENAVELFYSGCRKCWPYGDVGSACLVTTNYIGPMTVSFQGVAISEVPCSVEDIVTGCYTNGHYRTHSGPYGTGSGAGKAIYIQEGNFWFVDGARQTLPEVNWAPNSRLNWKIPVGWHRKMPGESEWHGVAGPDKEYTDVADSRDLLIGGVIDRYMQTWYIDLDGVCRTDKFGHWISRSRYCRVVLDGRVLQTNHPED